jgi:hypothetical protein
MFNSLSEGWRRLAIVYLGLGGIAVALVATTDEWPFRSCARDYVIPARADWRDLERYHSEHNAQRLSGCITPLAYFAVEVNQRRKAQGLPYTETCADIRDPLILPAEVHQLSSSEVLACSVEHTTEALVESRWTRLLLAWLLLPVLGWSGFLAGRWVWRGFKGG